MHEVAYHRSCPHCGQDLQPNAGGPGTPPWRCDNCRQSYWVAELTKHAREHYRKERRDWGPAHLEGHKRVRREVEAEVLEAHLRGISIRREQLGLVHKRAVIALMKTHHVFPHFAALIEGAYS